VEGKQAAVGGHSPGRSRNQTDDQRGKGGQARAGQGQEGWTREAQAKQEP